MFINKPSSEEHHKYKNVIDILSEWFYGRGLDDNFVFDFGSVDGSLVVAMADVTFMKSRHYFSGVLHRIRLERHESGFGFVLEDSPYRNLVNPLTDMEMGAELIKLFCEDFSLEPKYAEKKKEVEKDLLTTEV